MSGRTCQDLPLGLQIRGICRASTHAPCRRIWPRTSASHRRHACQAWLGADDHPILGGKREHRHRRGAAQGRYRALTHHVEGAVVQEALVHPRTARVGENPFSSQGAES